MASPEVGRTFLKNQKKMVRNQMGQRKMFNILDPCSRNTQSQVVRPGVPYMVLSSEREVGRL